MFPIKRLAVLGDKRQCRAERRRAHDIESTVRFALPSLGMKTYPDIANRRYASACTEDELGYVYDVDVTMHTRAQSGAYTLSNNTPANERQLSENETLCRS